MTQPLSPLMVSQHDCYCQQKAQSCDRIMGSIDIIIYLNMKGGVMLKIELIVVSIYIGTYLQRSMLVA